MSKNKKNILRAFLASSLILSLTACGSDSNLLAGKLFSPYEVESLSNVDAPKPLVIQIPSPNYNERPENTKIDTIVIHHTGSFSTLQGVASYFQDINSRVSAHYIIGKDGTIVQCVDERYRAWHAGVSSFLGKPDTNTYSIGIEILNNGDDKDPFTSYEYEALGKLTAYLMKKYEIPISNIVGHKDIALPLGVKIDPANNFDWAIYKAEVRKDLKQPKNLFAYKEEPKDSNTPISEIQTDLQDKQPEVRISALEKFFTVSFDTIKEVIEKLFFTEKNQEVKSKFLDFFKVYNKSFNSKGILNSAKDSFQDESNIDKLRIKSAEYIYTVDKEKSFDDFFKVLENDKTPKSLKLALIKIISNYSSNEKVKEFFTKQLAQTKDIDEKIALIDGISNLKDKSFNKILLSYIENKKELEEIKIASIKSLRVTYDLDVEKVLIKLIADEKISQNILETICDVFLRVGSKLGIEKLTQDKIYTRLNTNSKIGLIDTIGVLNLISYEEWLMIKAGQEREFIVKNAIFSVLGRLKQDRSFDFIYNSFKGSSFSPEMNFTLLNALTNYDYLEVITALLNILKADETEQKIPLEVKMKVLSTIKDKNYKVLLPYVKALYNYEMPDSNYKKMLKETIESLNKKE